MNMILKLELCLMEKNYASFENGQEDTQIDHTKSDIDSDDRKEDTISENFKRGLVNADGKKDTLFDEQTKPVSTSENGKEDTLSGYGEKEKVTMQMHNEEESMYTEKAFILLFDHTFLTVRYYQIFLCM